MKNKPLIEKIQHFIGLRTAKEPQRNRSPDVQVSSNALRTVYTEKNYSKQYLTDLSNSESLITIVSPYATARGSRELADVLSSAVKRDVRVCTFLQEPRGWHDRDQDYLISKDIERIESASNVLTKHGVHVTLRPRDHFKLTIIDGHILWEGSLNFLSHYDTRERITRWVSPGEVIAATTLHELNCPSCIQGGLMMPIARTPQELITHIGQKVAEQRRLLGLSQHELGAMTGIHYSVLSRLERGVDNASIATVSTVCTALGLDILVLERHLVPTTMQQPKRILKPKS